MTPEQAFIRALLNNEAALRAYEYACAVNLRYDPGQIQAALHRALRALGAADPSPVERWGAENGLLWHVRWSSHRWIASFSDCHVSTSRQHIGGLGVYGEGDTPAAAVRAYGPKIEGRMLCHCPGWDPATARWLDVPRWAGWGEPTKPDTVRVTFDWAGFKADMEAAVAEHRRAHAVMQTCDDAPSGLCATEAERDVATDPRVGDVLTPPGLVMGYPVIDVTLDGDVWVQTYDVVGRGVFTREHWRIACRTPAPSSRWRPNE